MNGPITRFAPSPSGLLHLGHAFSAVTGHVLARSGGGVFRLRIEDLDPARSRLKYAQALCEDLDWLGIDWDGAPIIQSERNAAYEDALEALRSAGLAYACFCTRSDIARAMIAPHGKDGPHYPGTCRTLAADPDRRAAMPHSWRLDSAKAIARVGVPGWVEQDGTRFCADPDDFDDIILARKDAPAAYHLACVVDDAASGVTVVTRGADLRSSTPVQRLLQTLLGLPEPSYLHHALVAHADGRRLAKRDSAPTLAAIRASGRDGGTLAAQLAAGELPLGFAFISA